MSSIHGHQVLEMMIASDQRYTIDSLIFAISQRFGQNARFHTCSQQNLTAAELVNFLQNKGKFIPTDEGFTTHVNKICHY